MDISDVMDFEFDIDEPATEVVGEIAAGTAIATAAYMGTSAGINAITGAHNKSVHKRSLKGSAGLTDEQWKQFQKGIKTARASFKKHLVETIQELYPTSQDSQINKTAAMYQLITSTNDTDVRNSKLCPFVKVKWGWLTNDTFNGVVIKQSIVKKINDDLKKENTNCRIIDTRFNKSDWGIVYSSSSSAKESIDPNFSNDMELDMIALEAAIMNYETINNFDEIIYTEPIMATESTSESDSVFGMDLFTTIASESDTYTPAMEGIGSKIATAFRNVITALKNFFIKIGNAVKGLISKITHSSKNKPEVQKGTKEYDELMSKLSGQADKMLGQQVTLYNMIGAFVRQEAAETKQIVNDINTIISFDRYFKSETEEQALASVGKDVLSKYEKSLDKWRNRADSINNQYEKINTAYNTLSKTAEETVDQFSSAFAKVDEDKIDNGNRREAIIKMFKEHVRSKGADKFKDNIGKVLDELYDLTLRNSDNCDHMLHKGMWGDEINKDELKSKQAKIGFDVCKIYLSISKPISRIHTILNLLYNLNWVH